MEPRLNGPRHRQGRGTAPEPQIYAEACACDTTLVAALRIDAEVAFSVRRWRRDRATAAWSHIGGFLFSHARPRAPPRVSEKGCSFSPSRRPARRCTRCSTASNGAQQPPLPVIFMSGAASLLASRIRLLISNRGRQGFPFV